MIKWEVMFMIDSGRFCPPAITYLYLGCIHLLNTRKYCGNSDEDWANTWKMWSPASAIFASIVTILVSFEAILKMFTVSINFKSQFQSNDLPQALKYIKIASKLTSIVTKLTNIALAGEHIFQVLGQYLWVLPQYLQVLSQYLRVLSRWIHPKYFFNSPQLVKNSTSFRITEWSYKICRTSWVF